MRRTRAWFQFIDYYDSVMTNEADSRWLSGTSLSPVRVMVYRFPANEPAISRVRLIFDARASTIERHSVTS